MKLLVISDTHRDISKACKILNDIGDMLCGVIHCGDLYDDFQLLKARYKNLKFYGVKGNCDYGCQGENEEVITVGGKRIFITHGHNYGVNFSTDRIYYRAMELGVNACLYGHTHIPLCENCNGIVILNPGSLTLPRGNSKASYGILTIEDAVYGSIVEYRGV